MIVAAARKARARLSVAFEAREQAAILAMVAEGLGVSIVPTLGLPSDTGNVVARPLEPRTPRTLALGHLPGVSPAARAFLDQVANSHPPQVSAPSGRARVPAAKG